MKGHRENINNSGPRFLAEAGTYTAVNYSRMGGSVQSFRLYVLNKTSHMRPQDCCVVVASDLSAQGPRSATVPVEECKYLKNISSLL